MVRAGIDEVEQPSTAVELGQEHGGVGLRLGRLDPREARPYRTVIAAPFTKNSTPIAAHYSRTRLIDSFLLFSLLLPYPFPFFVSEFSERESERVRDWEHRRKGNAKVGVYLWIQWGWWEGVKLCGCWRWEADPSFPQETVWKSRDSLSNYSIRYLQNSKHIK